MTRAAFQALYDAAGRLVAETPALRDFGTWPAIPGFRKRKPTAIPAIQLITARPDPPLCSPAQSAFLAALRVAAPFARWYRSYKRAQVGRDFLDRYGWFELLGPSGHFRSDAARAYVAYWGDGLVYPDHAHAAEEIYYVVAGGADFASDGVPSATLAPGDTRLHGAWQSHAMTTTTSDILTLVLWRGEGLAGKPVLLETAP
ncbi:MAG: dimethylsulfonioproprionate lyase family protein [Pseudomonadota bacterium]